MGVLSIRIAPDRLEDPLAWKARAEVGSLLEALRVASRLAAATTEL